MALDDSSELLETIKVRGSVPVNAGTWTNAALLKAATDAILTIHLPMLVDAKGEFLIRESLVATVEGQQEYLPSYRSAATRQLALKRADGHELPIEELKYPGQSPMALDRTRKGTPRWFWFRDNYFGVWPLPDSEASNFIVRWHMRPSRIVVTTDCWQILSITANSPSAGLTRIAFATVAPTAMAGALNSAKYDFVGNKNPFPVKGFDVVTRSLVTAGVSTTIDFTSSELPSDLAVDDWVAPFQKSPFANVPQELHVPAALRAAAAAVGSRNSKMKLDLIAEAVDEEKRLLRGLLVPRSKGNIQRIVTTRWRRR